MIFFPFVLILRVASLSRVHFGIILQSPLSYLMALGGGGDSLDGPCLEKGDINQIIIT